MTTTMTITLLIIAAASIALNVFQLMERKAERKSTDKLIADAALLERRLEELQSKFDNQKLHTEWAIGRLKDQQAVIDQLKQNLVPRTKKPHTRKEAHND